ncbi:hypothetical protein FPV67DRAFT_1718055, partial [Lyophyllum atratum]
LQQYQTWSSSLGTARTPVAPLHFFELASSYLLYPAISRYTLLISLTRTLLLFSTLPLLDDMDTLAPSRHLTGPLAPSGTLQGSPLPVSECSAPTPTVAAALQLPHHWNDLDLLFRDPPEFLRRCQPELTRFWLRLGYNWPRHVQDRVETATLEVVQLKLRALRSKNTINILALYFELIVPIIRDVDEGLSMSPDTNHLSRMVHEQASRVPDASQVSTGPSETTSKSREPGTTAPFRSIMKRSERREHHMLAPVNVTYRGGDHNSTWRLSSSDESRSSRPSTPPRNRHSEKNGPGSGVESRPARDPNRDVSLSDMDGQCSRNGVDIERRPMYRPPNVVENFVHLGRNSGRGEGMREMEENGGRHLAVGQVVEMRSDERTAQWATYHAAERANEGFGAIYAPETEAPLRLNPRAALGVANVEEDGVVVHRRNESGRVQALAAPVWKAKEERVARAPSDLDGGRTTVDPSVLTVVATAWFEKHPHVSSRRAQRMQELAMQASEDALRISRGWVDHPPDAVKIFEGLLQTLTEQYEARREERRRARVEEMQVTARDPPWIPVSSEMVVGVQGHQQGVELSSSKAMLKKPPVKTTKSSKPSSGTGAAGASSNALRALWPAQVVEENRNVKHGVLTRHAELVEPMLGSETKSRATQSRVDGKNAQAGVIFLAHRVLEPGAAGVRDTSVHGVLTRHAGAAELVVSSKRVSKAIHTRVDGKEVEMGGKDRAHSQGARRGRVERATSALKVDGNDLSRSREANMVSAPWMTSSTPSQTSEKVHLPSKPTPACSKARENPSPGHAGHNSPRPSMVHRAGSEGLAMVAAVAGHDQVAVHPRGGGRRSDRARGTSTTALDGGSWSTKRSHVTSTRTRMTPADFLPDAMGHDPVLLEAVRGLHTSGIPSPSADLLARITADMDRGMYTSQLNAAVLRYCKSDTEADGLIDLVNHGARYRALEWFMDSGSWRPPFTARRIASMSRQPRGYLPRLVDMVFDHMEVERAFIMNAQRKSTPSTVPVVNHFNDDSSVDLSDDDVVGNNLAYDSESDAELVSASRSPDPSVVGGYDCSETRSASTNVEYLACMRQLVPCQTSDKESLGNGRLSKGTADAPEILAYDVRTYRCEEECSDFRYYTEELDRVSVDSDDFVDEPTSGSDYGSDQSSRSDQEEGGSSADYYDENEEGVYEDADTQYEPDNGSNYHDSEPDEGSESSDFYSDGY